MKNGVKGQLGRQFDDFILKTLKGLSNRKDFHVLGCFEL
jgi:hypothetical protein